MSDHDDDNDSGDNAPTMHVSAMALRKPTPAEYKAILERVRPVKDEMLAFIKANPDADGPDAALLAKVDAVERFLDSMGVILTPFGAFIRLNEDDQLPDPTNADEFKELPAETQAAITAGYKTVEALFKPKLPPKPVKQPKIGWRERIFGKKE